MRLYYMYLDYYHQNKSPARCQNKSPASNASAKQEKRIGRYRYLKNAKYRPIYRPWQYIGRPLI